MSYKSNYHDLFSLKLFSYTSCCYTGRDLGSKYNSHTVAQIGVSYAVLSRSIGSITSERDG